MPDIKKNQRIGVYQVTLNTDQPLHLGAFQDPMSDVNSPFTTLGGEIVVQGPSLKGALRAQLEEYLALNYPDNPAMRPCIPAPYNNTSQDERGIMGQNAAYRGANCGSNRNQPIDLCPTCYLLGTMGLLGFVQTPYLYLVSAGEEDRAEEVYANRRDRALNRVADGANRTLQAVGRRSTFAGELEILLNDSIRGWTFGQARRKLKKYKDTWLESIEWQGVKQEDFIKQFVIDRLEAIPRMGGQVSKGFGNVKIEVKHLREKAV